MNHCVKNLVILADKKSQPLLFYATDFFKFPLEKVFHVLYKIKQDPECPFINIRILTERTDFGNCIIRIQVLNFVFACLPYERLISLSQLKVLSEQ